MSLRSSDLHLAYILSSNGMFYFELRRPLADEMALRHYQNIEYRDYIFLIAWDRLHYNQTDNETLSVSSGP